MAKGRSRGVIPLRPRQKSSWPTSPSARLRELLKRRDIQHLVRTMPVPDLYNFVRQLGLADAGDLLSLASGEQLQQMTDLEVWTKDRLATPRLMEWLEAIFVADPEKVAQRVGELDPEVILTLLLKHMVVFTNEGDEMSPEKEHEIARRDVIPTPDDVFYVEISGEPDEVDFIRRLLMEVYRQDVDLARSLLFRLLGQLPSQLEEAAYRIRQGRVEGLGFVDFYEALKIYQALPKNTPLWPRHTRGTGSDLQQVPLTPELAKARRGSFLATVLGEFQETYPRDGINRDLLHLANKVAAAELWDSGDEANAALALSRVHDHVSIGLEMMTDGDIQTGVELLRDVHVERIFRECQTALIVLQRRAEKGLRAIQEAMNLPLGLTIWPDPPNREIFNTLKGRVPHFDGGLIGEGPDPRPFRSHEEVSIAGKALDGAIAALRFLQQGLAIAPGDPQAIIASIEGRDVELRASHILLTSLGQRILGGPFSPDPLTPKAALRLIAALRMDGAKPDSPKGLKPEVLGELRKIGESQGYSAGVHELIEAADLAFKESYGSLDLSLTLDLRFIEGPFLIEAT